MRPNASRVMTSSEASAPPRSFEPIGISIDERPTSTHADGDGAGTSGKLDFAATSLGALTRQ